MSRRSLVTAAALFLFVLGARWTLIGRFGSDLPEMDQWDAEARETLQPWFEHHSLAHLFSAHNEHRIAPTRLSALVLAAVNHQWDQRLEAVLNAFLPAAVAAGLWLAAAGRYRRGAVVLLGILIAIALGGPFAWENTIHGFQSQQWFLIVFALGAIAWLPFAEPWRARWWAGAACAALSLITMGSGVAAACACAAVMAIRWWRGNARPQAALATLGACLVLAAIGWRLRVVFPGHAALHAHSVRSFWWAAIRYLGWPAFSAHWGYMALLLWLPWFWVAARLLRRTSPAPARLAAWFGVGTWALLQIAATAYARGASPPPPAPRYLDNFFVGIIANGFCLAELFGELRPQPEYRLLLRILAACWAGLFGLGLAYQSIAVVPGQLSDLPRFEYYSEANVRNFVATGDPAYIHHWEIPYPDDQVLAETLEVPAIRSLLPASVRAPLVLRTDRASGFVTWDTRGRQGAPPFPRARDGLSPATAPLENARFHGSYSAGAGPGPAAWRSGAVVSPVHGWLQFLVAGDLGRRGTVLDLRDAETDRVVARVAPDQIPGNGWHNAFVRAPKRPFFVEARANSPTTWFAFADPIEMGSFSHWAWRAVRHGPMLMVVAGLLFLGLLLAPARPAGNHP